MNNPREFWNELITKASWEKLLEINQRYEFILIGGWATYLWTKKHKSKDIDIVVDYSELQKFNAEFRLEKNERLKKYEIKLDDFDIDIYLPKFSKLSLPVEVLSKYKVKIEGINTISSEALVVLKQGAEIARRGSIKGRKDQIDLLTILTSSDFDIKKYSEFITKYRLERYKEELINVVKNFSKNDLAYVGFNEHYFSKWKKEFLRKILN